MITLTGPATCSFCFIDATDETTWFGFSTPGFTYAWEGSEPDHRDAHIACGDCGPYVYGRSWRALANRMIAGWARQRRGELALADASEGNPYKAEALALQPDEWFIGPGFRSEVAGYLLALGRVVGDHVPVRVGVSS